MIPLSTRMRPESLDDFFGQTHFLYNSSLLYNSIKNKTFESAIFFGPSGTGKTTLARIISKEMDAGFCEVNASTTGIKEIKEIIEFARTRFYGLQKETTYVYVDEFHRWNKLQQDSLLKALEEGVIKFIGSTTENPYFSINNAVLSRVRSVYEFYRLSQDELVRILRHSLNDSNRGLKNLDLKYEDSVLEMIADLSSGDARIALDTLGFIADNIEIGDTLTLDLVGEAMQQRTKFYENSEDKYNLLSALQKSIRGSDPDAGLHYLARLIEGGADPLMIGRRLMVIASEDIGMAYPGAIGIVTSCVHASLMVGFPEARINLAQAVILMASSPKSNSVIKGIDGALQDLRNKNIDDVPPHLKDAHYKGAKGRGSGKGYKYPHSFGGYIEQQYLPDNLHKSGVVYYSPTDNGKEGAFKKFLESLGKKYGCIR